MKKILFILLSSFIFVTTNIYAENEDFGKVGIDDIQIKQVNQDLIKINTTFFNLSENDIDAHLEISITDTYSKEQLKNINKITSDVLDQNIVFPKKNNSYKKEYLYHIPQIVKKDSYRIELRVVDNHENVLYVRQSKDITLGNISSPLLSNIITDSKFNYDNNQYDLQDGPIVTESKKDTAFYSVEIENNANENIIILIDYSTRKYASDDINFVKDTDSSVKVDILKKSKKIIKIPVKYTNQPGTHEGKIDLYLEKSEKSILLKTEEFRYMVGDSFITITDANISSSAVSLYVLKTLFDFTTELTEEYLNSTSSNEIIKKFEDSVYTFTVEMLDDKNNVISTQESEFKWKDILPVIDIPLTADSQKNTNISNVKVNVTDQNKTIIYTGTFGVSLSNVDPIKNKNNIPLIILILITIITIIGYIKNRNKFWLILILIFFSMSVYISYSNISATSAINSGNFSMTSFGTSGISPGSHKNCSAQGYRGVNIQAVNYPSPSETFTCGETVSVELKPVNGVCGNNSTNTYFFMTASQGLDMLGDVRYNSTLKRYYVKTYYRSQGGSVVSYPLQFKIHEGYTGDAYVSGYYHQDNGACHSNTQVTTFTFKNITCSKSCVCDGRDSVCTTGSVVSTTTNATECKVAIGCATSLSGNQGTFSYSGTNVIGSPTYVDIDTGDVLNSSHVRNVYSGQTVTQRTKIIDSFDNTEGYSSCSITNDGSGGSGSSTSTATTTASTTQKFPRIVSFSAASPVVEKGNNCTYDWTTEDFDSCSVFINNQSMSLLSPGTAGPLKVSTDNGLNQYANLVCISEYDGFNVEVVLEATSTCQVIPEVIER